MADVDETIDYPVGYNTDAPKRPVFYDTLSDLPIKNGMTLSNLSKMLWGSIKVQPNVQGVILVGNRDTKWISPAPWGLGVRFGEEVWYVRSKPRRRIGKPLRPGEVRQIIVMTTPAHNTTSFVQQVLSAESDEELPPPAGHGRIQYGEPLNDEHAWVATIRLHLKRPALAMDTMPTYPCHESYGPSGVPLFGMQLFEHNGPIAMNEVKGHTSKSGYHILYCSHANVYAASDPKIPKNKSKAEEAIKLLSPSVVHEGSHVCNVAASLLGVTMKDLAATETNYQAVEKYTSQQWDVFNGNCMTMIQEGLKVKYRESELAKDGVKLFKMSWNARMDAVALCSDLSMVGILDMLADEIHDGGLPDAAHRPFATGLAISIAVRLACFPHRYSIAKDELQTGTPNDIVAAQRVADMFESSMPPLLSSFDESPLYAIDVLLRNTLSNLEEDIRHSKQSRSSRMREQMHITPETLISRIKDALQGLFRHGCEVCNDVMGVLPQSAGTAFCHGEFGYANDSFDPLTFSRNEAAWSVGLGVLRPMDISERVTSRGERIAALRRVMQATEAWLRTGKYCGRILLQSMHDGEENGPMPAVDLDDGDDTEFESVLSPHAETSNKTKRSLLVQPTPGNGKTAAGRTGGGSTKSKRAKQRRERALNKQEYTPEAKAKGKEIELLLSNGLSKAAFVLGENALETLLCNSPNLGMDEFGTSAFVVSPYSYAQCSCCSHKLHVLEGIGMASRFGKCSRCNRRRCMTCTQHFVSVLALWDDEFGTQLPPEPTCLFCNASESAGMSNA